MKTNKTVWGSEKILTLQRNFYAAKKPDGLTSTDVGAVALLLSYKAVDHEVTHSLATLASSLSCDQQTIRRSLVRLEDLKWIHRTARKGRSDEIELLLDNIPLDAPLSHQITDEARDLVKAYVNHLTSLGKKKFYPHFVKNQWYSAQNIINKCDGDVALAKQMLVFATNDPTFKRAASASLYKLWSKWRKLERAYSEYLQIKEKAAQEIAAKAAHKMEMKALAQAVPAGPGATVPAKAVKSIPVAAPYESSLDKWQKKLKQEEGVIA